MMMRWQSDIGLALRLLARDWRARELTLVALAVVVAVASVTTVDFFTDRVYQALSRQANQLLGADLVVTGDRPLGDAFETEANRRGLKVTRMLRFPSMTAIENRNVLSEVKVVSAGYPLRGELRIADAPYQPDRRATSIPEPGTVWVDEKLYTRLQLQAGDAIEVGNSRLKISAIITQEPDSAVGFINAGPRVLLNEADIAATGLVQIGSRLRYRVQVAGAPEAVDAYRVWVNAQLAPGQRVESIEDARPEIRSALDRAGQFLGLSTLLSVILAAVAIALATRRFLQRHLDACAIMRCHGHKPGQGRAAVFAAVHCAGLCGESCRLCHWLAGAACAGAVAGQPGHRGAARCRYKAGAAGLCHRTGIAARFCVAAADCAGTRISAARAPA